MGSPIIIVTNVWKVHKINIQDVLDECLLEYYGNQGYTEYITNCN